MGCLFHPLENEIRLPRQKRLQVNWLGLKLDLDNSLYVRVCISLDKSTMGQENLIKIQCEYNVNLMFMVAVNFLVSSLHIWKLLKLCDKMCLMLQLWTIAQTISWKNLTKDPARSWRKSTREVQSFIYSGNKVEIEIRISLMMVNGNRMFWLGRYKYFFFNNDQWIQDYTKFMG